MIVPVAHSAVVARQVDAGVGAKTVYIADSQHKRPLHAGIFVGIDRLRHELAASHVYHVIEYTVFYVVVGGLQHYRELAVLVDTGNGVEEVFRRFKVRIAVAPQVRRDLHLVVGKSTQRRQRRAVAEYTLECPFLIRVPCDVRR